MRKIEIFPNKILEVMMFGKIKELIDKIPVKKKYWVPGIIILVLILLLIFSNTDRTYYKLPELDKFDKDDINKLLISDKSNSISLIKDNNRWLIGPKNYLADKTKIDEIIDVLVNFKITDLVSESKNYLLYELTDEMKINVKAYQDKKVILDFDIGKVSPTYSHTFVKLGHRSEVYNAKEDFRSKFDKKVEDLRDKNIYKFDSKNIKTVVLADRSGKKLNIKKEEIVVSKTNEDKKVSKSTRIEWKSDKGKKIKESELDDILNTLDDLSCDSFIDDQKKEDFKRPIYSVTVKNTKEYNIRIFKKKDDKYPAVADSRDYAFWLSSYDAERIMKKFKDLYE